MKIYSDQNVYDAAIDRIRFLFDEFENVVVGFSGGKDSTVCLNLALKVAEEKNRLPLRVAFLDQEAEWESVIDYVRDVMSDPRVHPMWFQVPIKLFNATSTTEPWLYCWEKGKENEWMRPKEPNAITENIYGTDRFAEMFEKIFAVEFPNQKSCYISGVRAEESPARAVALTSAATYKYITYGKILNKKKEHYTFYPLYDWTYVDIWKAIHDNGWQYCKIYDYMYQYGVKVKDMRVSNVHHETAVKSLYYLQEIEGKTWQKLTKRISGINTAGQMKSEAFKVIELPPMFESWTEYRDYLLENLIHDEEVKTTFRNKFEKLDKLYTHPNISVKRDKMCIQAIMHNDYHMTKIVGWERQPEVHSYREWKTKGILGEHILKNMNNL